MRKGVIDAIEKAENSRDKVRYNGSDEQMCGKSTDQADPIAPTCHTHSYLRSGIHKIRV